MARRFNILVIGSGGREHALAWKLAQSPRTARVIVAPGNGGTAPLGVIGTSPIDNIGLTEDNFEGLIDFARQAEVGLTVVGPEVPLAAGIVDAFQAAGLACFGPTQAAAQIESSKVYAKDFMRRHGIPTGRYAVFDDYEAALDHLHEVDYEVVIKASGLAAGKGVIVPESRSEAVEAVRQMMVERAFGHAADQVLIEERLRGQEASLLAFSDGRTIVPMPPAQDHKAIFDGDRGPNTGGMGAYAPTPLVTPELLTQVIETVLQPTIAGLRAEGRPYIGILYAGLILTPAGPQVLEFNCRFGDPETQVILPLLTSDLVEIMLACLDDSLDQVEVTWRIGAAATVVAAAAGYPGSYRKGLEISGIETAATLPETVVFHAGTHWTEENKLVTNGGRVLAVTGLGETLPAALERAYTGIEQIHFEGIYYRRDIGAKALV